jgi:hypothetical protein
VLFDAMTLKGYAAFDLTDVFFDALQLPNKNALHGAPSLIGGSATGLSATDAWAKPLPVMA